MALAFEILRAYTPHYVCAWQHKDGFLTDTWHLLNCPTAEAAEERGWATLQAMIESNGIVFDADDWVLLRVRIANGN